MLINIGSTLLCLQQYDRARDTFLSVLDSGTNAVRILARCHHGLGVAYRDLGDPITAQSHTTKSVELYEGVDQRKWIESKHNLAILWADQGYVPQAKDIFESCIQYYAKHNLFTLLASGWEELASIAMNLQQWDEALECIEKDTTAIYSQPDVEIMIRLLRIKDQVYRCQRPTDCKESPGKMADFMERAQAIHDVSSFDLKRFDESLRQPMM